jgi:CRP-like cAMP-binding protein
VGTEGMAGLPVFLGGQAASAQCIVQVPGQALRMSAHVFRAQVNGDSNLHGLLQRYTHAFLTHLSQSVACNSLHSIEKRCCRWLLMTQRRARADRFPMTHEFLAAMLGVRRASVTEVAQTLQAARLIRYKQGQVTVLDRQGLETSACECYSIVEEEFSRLFG